MTAGDTDDQLAVRAAKGDRRAYSVLARRYGDNLAQAARGFGLPETDIDDVVQEALFAAWRHLAYYDPARSFRGWLFRIAVNKMRDLRRHRRVRRFLFGAGSLDDAEHMLFDDAPDPERHAIATGDLKRVREVLDGLDRELREAIVLTALVGLSQPEAAETLGISVKSVEGRVGRARRRLAQLLSEKSADPEGDARRAP